MFLQHTPLFAVILHVYVMYLEMLSEDLCISHGAELCDFTILQG